jgi:predicted acetyltransferase
MAISADIGRELLKSFLPVEAEITVTKVFITANMKNSKSHCKQEVDVW